MPARRAAELAGLTLLATVMTLTIAAPVVLAPTTRVFGMEIVGRHHDPFTVMEQIARPQRPSVYSQPVTDLTGRALARVAGAVPGYNALVLLSFPLSAIAAYLLARHLTLSPMAASVAATAYAFSPFHFAHAAYHAHVAQTQWLPLYLLALWRSIDRPSPSAVALLGVATFLVTLSNFYGALIAAVITPMALLAYGFATRRRDDRPWRRIAIITASLAAMAAAGASYVSLTIRSTVMPTATRDDLFLYSAKWWSYLVPPVANPLLGAAASRTWAAAGVSVGLLEQQVYLGWSLIALSLIAIGSWLVATRQGRVGDSRAFIPLLTVVAATALFCSLSPERRIGAFTFMRPSSLLYAMAPMFRSYARFGVVVQLMTALLAGIGLDVMRRAGSRAATVAAVLLVAIFVGEYSVAPAAMSRDVLPTPAHRWVASQPETLRVLDCAPLTPESESVRWLTHGRVTLADAADDCLEPEFPAKLAALGYTHLLVRRRGSDGDWFATRALPDGLRVAQHFADADIYTVTARPPLIYTAIVQRFSPRESDPVWSWRWMGTDASWTVVNTQRDGVTAAAALELAAFHHPRRLELWIDGQRAQALDIRPERQTYVLGPFTLTPGAHLIVFHPVEAPTVAGALIRNGDTRALAFAIGNWRWTAEGVRQ